MENFNRIGYEGMSEQFKQFLPKNSFKEPSFTTNFQLLQMLNNNYASLTSNNRKFNLFFSFFVSFEHQTILDDIKSFSTFLHSLDQIL